MLFIVYSIILSEMSIKINSFGGPLIWGLRKHFSGLTSMISLTVVEKIRRNKIDSYIEMFYQVEKIPNFKFLMIETINRCNGTCAFCPANVRAEKREYKKMSDSLFYKIIDELENIGWSGTIFLQVNNEPLVDARILKFARQVKKQLPYSKTCIITNGTLLTLDKVKEMALCIDELVINNYSENYRLTPRLKEIYKYVKKNQKQFARMSISINRRYSGEILTTRAGSAPNKHMKNNQINSSCIYPFTDMIIFPDGKVGMCCNDCFEVTNFGDVNEEHILDIWRGAGYGKLRDAMRRGRNHYMFCKECDVIDAGSREKVINEL